MFSDTEDNPVTTVRGLEVSTLADGLFHMATWLLVVAGVVAALMSWRQGPARAVVDVPARPGPGGVGTCSTSSRGSSTTRSWARTTCGTPWEVRCRGTWVLAFGVALVMVGAPLHRAGEREPNEETAAARP